MNCLRWLTPLLILSATSAHADQKCIDFVQPTVSNLAMKKFKSVFSKSKPVIAMLHLSGVGSANIVARALREMRTFEQNGVDAVIVENYHGKFSHVVKVLKAIQGKFPAIVVGLNILPNEYEIAFELARTYGAKFIQLDFVAGRYEGYKDEILELEDSNYLKFRKKYSDILVLGGVWPKYYSPIKGSELDQDLKKAQVFADAVVVTGEGTGMATPIDKIKKFREILGEKYPLIVGAGVTLESVSEQLSVTDGLIIGSYFKDGKTEILAKPARVQEFMNVVNRVRDADQ